MKQSILSLLSPDYPWKDLLHCYACLPSTNDHLKHLARQGAPEGTAILAASQTGGHGRMGRSFHSPEGTGVYLSVLLRPQCPPARLMHLTCAVGVAMCDAVESVTGARPGIKWINDLVFQGRKVGGILTELGLTPDGNVDFAVIGIGINCCQTPEDFPPELRTIAGSLSMAVGAPVSPAEMAAAMLRSLASLSAALLPCQASLMAQYRRDCITLNREVTLLRGEERRQGFALDVDDSGALLVVFPDGHREAVNSGEASVRGLSGYL